jgi:hypothetical protein
LEDRRLADRDQGYPMYRTAPPTRLDALQTSLAAGLVVFEEPRDTPPRVRGRHAHPEATVPVRAFLVPSVHLPHRTTRSKNPVYWYTKILSGLPV